MPSQRQAGFRRSFLAPDSAGIIRMPIFTAKNWHLTAGKFACKILVVRGANPETENERETKPNERNNQTKPSRK